MMSSGRIRIAARALIMAAGALVAGAAGRGQTAEQVIARARAYLGGETALEAVKSVHFAGTMQEFFGNDPKPTDSTVEIIFQKPYQQCIVRNWSDKIETTGLDDLEAWLRIQEVKTPGQWRLTLLGRDLVKRLRANTWENLNFYRGIEQRGGQVEVRGPATIDGVATIKVAFIHEPGILFIRYFENTTGRLVLTETEQGGQIKEVGEIMAGGLRFPAKVIHLTTGPDAKGQIVAKRMEITFGKVTLNEVFPDSRFAVPELSPPTRAAPAPPISR